MSVSLLLGPSGVGLSEIVTRLNQEAVRKPEGTAHVEVFDVEQELLAGVNWDSPKFPFHSENNMRDLLMGVTRRELMDLWKDALRSCLKRADASTAANTVIAFHPTLYASRRNEQYSTVGWALASGVLMSVERVVLLIDDVYDMWERLGDRHQDLFHHSEWLRRRLEAQGLDEFVDTIGERLSARGGLEKTFDGLVVDSAHAILARLLGWRHMDMIEAESLASALDAPLTTLGVKHPMSALQKLLNAPDTVTTYLSHPISRPRRARTTGVAWPPVVAESNELSSRFADADIVLVCPTAIDEFRLVQASQKADVFRRPFALGERWPLLVPPDDAINAEHHPSNRLTHIDVVTSELDEAIGAVARAVETEIYSEVPFRDHYLVTHTDGFFVFRPLYEEGDFSGGVRAEIVHWSQLAEFEPHRRALFVHSAEDVRLVKEALERKVTGERIRNSMRSYLRKRGISDDRIEELIQSERVRADMLDADTPSMGVARQRLNESLLHAGKVLFFGALTALPENWLEDERVAVRVLSDSAPSRNEIYEYSRFLGREDQSIAGDHLDHIENAIQISLVDWVQARLHT